MIIGTRVRLRRDVERFPHFIARAGATGVVSVREQLNTSQDVLASLREAKGNERC